MSEETWCRICGRRLTVPESVKREIGPVCWGRLQRGEIVTPAEAGIVDIQGKPFTVSILLPAKTFPKKEKA